MSAYRRLLAGVDREYEALTTTTHLVTYAVVVFGARSADDAVMVIKTLGDIYRLPEIT